MQFLAMSGIIVLGGVALAALLFLGRRRRAQPLYLRVEDTAENVEWLFLALLRQAPRRHLVIIDHTRGENKHILAALARRYHISAVEAAPDGAPLLYAEQGVTAESLLAQYAVICATAVEKQQIARHVG